MDIRSLSSTKQLIQYELFPLGDSCVLIRLGTTINEDTHKIVIAVTRLLQNNDIVGINDIVPAFASVAIHYNPVQVWKSRRREEAGHETIYDTMCTRLNQLLSKLTLDGISNSNDNQKIIRIPVCYGGEYGPDLGAVAEHCGRTESEVISLHSSGSYLVYMIGFAPAFPYLGGMPKRIATPRRGTPRTVTPAGSVGIAGEQTGIYPIATPGGWQIIGRTPIELFRPHHDQPSLLEAGDRIVFVPITEEQFEGWFSTENEVAPIV
ncbi:kinase A inhibitor [Paenibacillus sp. L3-i20]|nr:kinase A inhibitor [Paenibacillus sp. L3-i20]